MKGLNHAEYRISNYFASLAYFLLGQTSGAL